jgi:protocatechuate 3,4-dioxygenase beta subunit
MPVGNRSLSFSVANLPPGTYQLIALKNVDLEFRNPAAMEKYLSHATVVTSSPAMTPPCGSRRGSLRENHELLIFLLALLSAQSRAEESRQPPHGRIAGVVVDAVTNAPVPQAEVSIFLESEEIRIKSGADGRFRFEPLKAAKYQLYADAPGYIREAYNQHGSFSTAIAVGTGFDSEHLIFRLHPQAVIHGRVTDEHGDPVRSAAVHLFVSGNSGAKGQGSVQMQTQTDDLGEYRFAHLPAGNYRIAVQSRPGMRSQVSTFNQSRGQSEFCTMNPKPDPVLDVVYPVTFFPGVTDQRAAADLPVPAGSTEEANIQLQAVPAVHLRLTNLPFDQNGVSIGASQRVGNVQAGIPVVIAQISPEEYEVAGLPPGATTLEITRNDEQQQVPRTINADISDNDTLDAPRIVRESVGARHWGKPSRVSSRRVCCWSAQEQTVSIMLHKDGTSFPSPVCRAALTGSLRPAAGIHPERLRFRCPSLAGR